MSREPSKRQILIADLQCLGAAVMFGFGFCVQRGAYLEGLGPLTFNALRNLVGLTALTVANPFFSPTKAGKVDSSSSLKTDADRNSYRRVLYIATGLSLFNLGASTFSQFGIEYISASISSFVTGFYVVWTPICLLLFPSLRLHGEGKPNMLMWIAVVGSMIGLFTLCFSGGNSSIGLGKGEMLTVVSSLFYTGHIFLTDYAVELFDPIELTHVEMIVLTITSTLMAFCLEFPEWETKHIKQSWVEILALGIMECAGFLLAALGQVDAPSAHAAVIFGTEAVFATIGGYIFLGEVFNRKEFFGCTMMLCSVLLAKSNELGIDDFIESFTTKAKKLYTSKP
jgi:drug/metabolite transporter (DMT)-like permease